VPVLLFKVGNWPIFEQLVAAFFIFILFMVSPMLGLFSMHLAISVMQQVMDAQNG
jgi:hypothetical protein